MKYFTQQIPHPLAEKLKEKGMPMAVEFIPNYLGDPEGEAVSNIVPPSFAFVFDWLIEKFIFIEIHPIGKHDYEACVAIINDTCENITYLANSLNSNCVVNNIEFSVGTWYEAAEKAIEKALTLI